MTAFYFDEAGDEQDDEGVYREQRAFLGQLSDEEVNLIVGRLVDRRIVEGLDVDVAVDRAVRTAVHLSLVDLAVDDVRGEQIAGLILTKHPYALQLGRLAIIRAAKRSDP